MVLAHKLLLADRVQTADFLQKFGDTQAQLSGTQTVSAEEL